MNMNFQEAKEHLERVYPLIKSRSTLKLVINGFDDTFLKQVILPVNENKLIHVNHNIFPSYIMCTVGEVEVRDMTQVHIAVKVDKTTGFLSLSIGVGTISLDEYFYEGTTFRTTSCKKDMFYHTLY